MAMALSWRGGWRARAARALLLALWGLAVLGLSRLLAPRAAPSRAPRPAAPPTYWQLAHKQRSRYNHSSQTKACARAPSACELVLSDAYWQTLRSSGGDVLLYGAYLDVRSASRLGPAVRLLAVRGRTNRTTTTHCQLWYEDRADDVVVEVVEHTPVWNSKWSRPRAGELQPYLLACVLPVAARAKRPAAVSLVERPCDQATNCLQVQFDVPPDCSQKELAVCVKGLDFPRDDLSVRLVEWIELVRLLGADQVFFYQVQVHPNMSKVLEYYRARGAVEVTPITLPAERGAGRGWAPRLRDKYLKKKKTMHERRMELVSYNDCLYRHMYHYRWLALLDVDEVIVPLQDPDWSSLLKRVLPLAELTRAAWQSPPSSYHVSHVYYLETQGWELDVPRHMYMLQQVYRARHLSGPRAHVKAFHETSRVVALHNHLPRACLGGVCASLAILPEHARLQHYRGERRPGGGGGAPVRDAALRRWAARLVPRVAAVLADLQLTPLDT
ncbi:uncharacterized protein LOC125236801 [Leguminivora glycinivorella]|uniref:uncharacterized protein LOC125236801 n=1 Tax=Leguminivora glycinivorella TaxID=1035111 RepID=UPI00200D1FC0|nr:uncharacterized protein LOC125236801 [Leguminivora glycinivorella]